MVASEKDKQPKFSGFAIVAWLGWCSFLFLLAPRYLDVRGHPRTALFVVAIVLALIGFLGALTELSQLTEHEGFSTLAASAALLIPSGILLLWDRYASFTSPFKGLVRTAVLALAVVGGALFFYGFSYFFEPSPHEEVSRRHTRGELGKTIQTVTALVLSLATGIVGLINALSQ